MENPQLPKEIKERFLELPESVQKIILESGWEKTTRDIVAKYNLRIDQGALVETETMLVMFGFISPDKFKPDLISDAGVDEETADQIEKEISDRIFKLIKDKIILVTEEDEAEESAEEDISSVIDDTETPPDNLTKVDNRLIEDRLGRVEVTKPKRVDPYLEPIE